MDNHRLMFPLLLISLLSFTLLFFSLYARRRRRLRLRHCQRHSPPLITDIFRTINSDDHITTVQNVKSSDSSPNSSLLLEIWPALLEDNQKTNKSEPTAAGDEECEKKRKKKKKKRGKKKRSDSLVEKEELIEGIGKERENQDLVCLYPFTSSSSATQRKIKQQYDQLVKSHESNGLTLLQVGQFVNCLIEARNELKQKSEGIHRKFTITKALLFKADRSSFDRLRQQIYKLELEQKRLEEDAFVYNWLQQQLKLSPAYKKMLEIGACMESKPKSVEATEDSDFDISDISFEELLAQEKKDSFWQKKGKPKSGSG
ncbi:hypothetical protein L1987_45301 [Smallanthus sonchifolius]|uniref:Uncharacterized protein n=1 Tax=Smallanthus sonchifolius TaxID=185202 RepID=A0ACB9GRV8_9ASTR|nr:hypothetical protein L1987_45301 [Smallanthus sonchifolius]